MIDYFKHIFTTPEYQLSTLDRFMQIFIIFIGIAIIFGIIFCVALLIEKIKTHHRKKKKKKLKGSVADDTNKQ